MIEHMETNLSTGADDGTAVLTGKNTLLIEGKQWREERSLLASSR